MCPEDTKKHTTHTYSLVAVVRVADVFSTTGVCGFPPKDWFRTMNETVHQNWCAFPQQSGAIHRRVPMFRSPFVSRGSCTKGSFMIIRYVEPAWASSSSSSSRASFWGSCVFLQVFRLKGIGLMFSLQGAWRITHKLPSCLWWLWANAMFCGAGAVGHLHLSVAMDMFVVPLVPFLPVDHRLRIRCLLSEWRSSRSLPTTSKHLRGIRPWLLICNSLLQQYIYLCILVCWTEVPLV